MVRYSYLGITNHFPSKRCVILSTGFFEWSQEKQKYFFKLPGEETLYMARLYMIQNDQSRYCILTTRLLEISSNMVVNSKYFSHSNGFWCHFHKIVLVVTF